MGIGALVSSPSFAAFRPSPLNPAAMSSGVKPVFQKRDPAFPASRPLRPFPSVIRAITNAKPIEPIEPSARVNVHDDVPTLGGQGGTITGGKRPPKTIEISSKWRGGFFVLGMTQAEFSRRD